MQWIRRETGPGQACGSRSSISHSLLWHAASGSPDRERPRTSPVLTFSASRLPTSSAGREFLFPGRSPPPPYPGGAVSLRFQALSTEGASALLLASLGLSWRFGASADRRTDSPVLPAFSARKPLLALSLSVTSGLLPFRPLVEKVSNSLAFFGGRFREGSTLKRGRTGVGRNVKSRIGATCRCPPQPPDPWLRRPSRPLLLCLMRTCQIRPRPEKVRELCASRRG